MNLPLGRFPHLIALFTLMNKSYAESENSDADSSVVKFLSGKSHVAVKGAFMAAVIYLTLLIANTTLQGGNWQEKLQAAFMLLRCAWFYEEGMLRMSMKMAEEIFGHWPYIASFDTGRNKP